MMIDGYNIIMHNGCAFILKRKIDKSIGKSLAHHFVQSVVYFSMRFCGLW